MRDVLGGKGAGLAEMTRAGFPVPPGFTITTEVCLEFYRLGRRMPDGLEADVERAMAELERRAGKNFGAAREPLLVSVRSGAPVSMPGMMDTILNLGLNDETVAGLEAASGDDRFALDAYRRFISMFSGIVLGVERSAFDRVIADAKTEAGVELDTEIGAATWKRVIETFKRSCGKRPERISRKKCASSFAAPSLRCSTRGTPSAPSSTGATIRFPTTGARRSASSRWCSETWATIPAPESLSRAIRTPATTAFSASTWSTRKARTSSRAFARPADRRPRTHPTRHLPPVPRHRRLPRTPLPRHAGPGIYRRAWRLYMLQTRSAKRSAQAAVRVALDMVPEGIIDRSQALRRVDAASLDQLFHARIDPRRRRGRREGPERFAGRRHGLVAFDPETAVACAAERETGDLVRGETTPDDVHGMIAAAAC